MLSFNHYAYGAVVDWIYRHVAGIAPAAPGYRSLPDRTPSGRSAWTAPRPASRPHTGARPIGWALEPGRASRRAGHPGRHERHTRPPGQPRLDRDWRRTPAGCHGDRCGQAPPARDESADRRPRRGRRDRCHRSAGECRRARCDRSGVALALRTRTATSRPSQPSARSTVDCPADPKCPRGPPPARPRPVISIESGGAHEGRCRQGDRARRAARRPGTRSARQAAGGRARGPRRIRCRCRRPRIPDSAYTDAGATVVPTDALYEQSDVVLRVAKPSPAEVKQLRKGQAVVGFLAPLIDPGHAPRRSPTRA